MKQATADEMPYIDSGEHSAVQSKFLHKQWLPMALDMADKRGTGTKHTMSSMITRSPTSNGCVLFAINADPRAEIWGPRYLREYKNQLAK